MPQKHFCFYAVCGRLTTAEMEEKVQQEKKCVSVDERGKKGVCERKRMDWKMIDYYVYINYNGLKN